MTLFLLYFILIQLTNSQFYLSYPVRKNWFQARRACKNMGMELISIESLHKDLLIEAFLHNQNVDEMEKWQNEIWIAGTDLEVEGKFVWMPTGSSIDRYVHWSYNEPNGGNNENCVLLLFHPDIGIEWKDSHCKANSRFFMCEPKLLDY